MHDITKHNSEKERECDYSEYCWVHFFVDWDAIGVDYFLERHKHFVSFEEGGLLESFCLLGT